VLAAISKALQSTPGNDTTSYMIFQQLPVKAVAAAALLLSQMSFIDHTRTAQLRS
jgi:hypothetical protein